jgi:hypothetical protein
LSWPPGWPPVPFASLALTFGAAPGEIDEIARFRLAVAGEET